MSTALPTAPSIRSQEDRPSRKERIPFGVTRTKLGVKAEIPGYVLRWINDVGGRIMQAQQGGYAFVTPKEIGSEDKESQVKRIVGKVESGGPMYAYLMKIEKTFYDEDRATSQKEVDKFDAAIKSGTLEQRAGDNRYNGGIKISQS